MAEEAVKKILIEATPTRCFEIAIDFENYPEWASDIKGIEILEKDDKGRASKVAYKAEALGRSTSYSLAYDYSKAPRQLSWVLIEGDLERRLDGTLTFDPTDDHTEVTYELLVDLLVPLPGFIRRRAESRILDTLNELKARAESESGELVSEKTT